MLQAFVITLREGLEAFLIVAISLAGYVAYKLLGERTGAVIAGILGGLISSTATTVSYARRSKETPNVNNLAAFVIFVASTILLLRVVVIIAIAAPSAFGTVGPPLGTAFGALAVVSLILWFIERHNHEKMPEQTNPTELKPALLFGALFGIILLAAAAAKEHFGQQGLYTVAILSGLTDMDAITLSTAQMIHAGRLDADTGWRLILVASMSNLVFKGGVVAVMGTRRLFARPSALVFSASGRSGPIPRATMRSVGNPRETR